MTTILKMGDSINKLKYLVMGIVFFILGISEGVAQVNSLSTTTYAITWTVSNNASVGSGSVTVNNEDAITCTLVMQDKTTLGMAYVNFNNVIPVGTTLINNNLNVHTPVLIIILTYIHL